MVHYLPCACACIELRYVVILLMVQKSGDQHRLDVSKPMNTGISTIPQLVQDFFHQQSLCEKQEEMSCFFENHDCS